MQNELTPASLEEARNALGVDRKELARVAGVGASSVRDVEKGFSDPQYSRTWIPIVKAMRALTEAQAAREAALAAAMAREGLGASEGAD